MGIEPYANDFSEYTIIHVCIKNYITLKISMSIKNWALFYKQTNKTNKNCSCLHNKKNPQICIPYVFPHSFSLALKKVTFFFRYSLCGIMWHFGSFQSIFAFEYNYTINSHWKKLKSWRLDIQKGKAYKYLLSYSHWASMYLYLKFF